MLYLLERQALCDVVASMFDRWLTNAAGGNVTAKVNDEHWIMSPTLMAQEKFCKLKPENILVVDKDLNIIEGDGGITRETNMHMAIYRADPRVRAIIHAHPKEQMPFATMGIEIPLITEAVKKMVSFPCLSYAPATTIELANIVKTYVEQLLKEERNLPYGAALREHGVIIADTSLKKCYDMLERMETNAYTYVQCKLLELTGHTYKSTDGHDYNLEE